MTAPLFILAAVAWLVACCALGTAIGKFLARRN